MGSGADARLLPLPAGVDKSVPHCLRTKGIMTTVPTGWVVGLSGLMYAIA